MRSIALLSSLLLIGTAAGQGDSNQQIRLPRQPRVSPDGQNVAFSWQEDIWTASIHGGMAARRTVNVANDSNPFFSPDGRQIAFISDRTGNSQVHIMPASGGVPRQVTHDSNRKMLLGFTADGSELLIAQATDRGWSYTESGRIFTIPVETGGPKRMLFDAGGSDAALSPDGSKVLFTRGRAAWNRKGYRGSAASQLWLADLATSPATLTRLDRDRPHFQNVSLTNPMWAPDGNSYYYISDPDGTFDIYQRELSDPDGGNARRVTRVGQTDRSDDGVAFASLSVDGGTMVFRRRFDMHRLDLASGKVSMIKLSASGDSAASAIERRSETSSREVAFTDDGKQMAFVAGEDVYVMDRILKEPVQVTRTPHQESSLVFSSDGKRLFFVSDAGGEADIWEATHSQEENIWWLAEDFQLRQVTDDRAVERSLATSPAGKHVAYIKGTDLFVMDQDGSDHRRVVESWSAPSYDWAPDGRWITYATQDSDYNSDIWVVPLDGTRKPFNLSRHPDSDSSPKWSGDGTRIAFVSRREGEESDIYYFNLTKQEEEKTERDKKLEDALAAMKKKSSPGKSGGDEPSAGGADRPRGSGAGRGRRGRRGGMRPGGGGGQQSDPEPAADEPKDDKAEEGEKEKKDDEKEKKQVDVEIDFDGIHDRMHRISIADSRESGLIWSPDGKKLAFNATVEGQRGFYTVEFPKVEKPKKLASEGLASARWLKESKEIVGISSGRSSAGAPGGPPRGRRGFGGGGGGKPAAMSARGEVKSFDFSVRRMRDWQEIRRIAFDQGWRAMRDRFYDEHMNNRDWEAIRNKYRPVAAQSIGSAEFSELMNMMLGELNASHMGHRGGSDPLPSPQRDNSWTPTTYQLGLRFEMNAEGPGLVVESVIPGSPCHARRSQVLPGEAVLSIDGQAIGPDVDLDRLLTMDEVRDVELMVADSAGNERAVTVRPTRSVQGLLYDEFVENTRRAVEEQSDGTLGYLHIRGMNMSSFRDMEKDLYDAGEGKEGLIIDVRFNGGGSTTDHVLTALTQPVHAITRSRGSGKGYPQDRKVYASWSKPIVLMCNEHSFSNAEILSHAVKQIGRGRLVGMRTAGGVISTGSARLLDGSSVRMPTRGWYLVSTGEDMELNGCLPDIALWNPPGGADEQLKVAVRTLLEDVAKEKARGDVKIEPAAARRLRQSSEFSSEGEK